MGRIITLKEEKVLVNIFCYLLSNGIARGITEKQYFNILNKTINKINAQNPEDVTPVALANEGNSISFEEIVKKANAICSVRGDGISITKSSKRYIAKPTYSFMKNEWWREIRLGWYPRHEEIFHQVINSVLVNKHKKAASYKITESELYLAKKIAAKFINELIKKYVYVEIEKHRWPEQCRDVDQYVFEKNIAAAIDEQGTAEIFIKLYRKAIASVCALIKENKGDFSISNNEDDMLAYANYLRFLKDEEFKFLIPLKHNKYKTHDVYIKCIVLNGDITCYSRKCIYSDPYDDDDDYASSVDSIPDEEIEVMEKRIANICNK